MAKLVWAVDISIRQIPYAVMPHTHGRIKTNFGPDFAAVASRRLS